MKHLLIFCFFFLLCNNLAKAQTYANIPGPENVLVVYKQPTGPMDTLGWVSDSVMQYYTTARNIPAVNVVGLMKF
ncbi:MAG: hypothetical protein ACK4ON_11975 [Bacteroidia bacterium]